MSPTLVILLVGSFVAASCALVGSFLVLRKMALLGDAISHAVLPGIAIAFLMTGNRAALPMVLGAGALGVLTVLLVELFNRSRRLREDASIGVVFPALFSLGVILISRYAAQVDLDLDCVLYGEIAYAPWDTLALGGSDLGPKALWVNGGVLLLNLAWIAFFYKELKLSTFDAGLAAALGFWPALLHYLLMSAVSVTVVGAFESVGAILVVAMLVVPPATAYLLAERLGRMLALAVVLGVASALGGYALARLWDASIAGAMATVAGLLFLAALLFSPGHGLVARLLILHRMGHRLAGQLVLLHLQKGGEVLPVATLERRFGWGPRKLQKVLARLLREELIESRGEGLRLTPKGAQVLESTGRIELAHRLTSPA
jgi:manganese/zinc/iron transport system permease protein